MQLPCGALALWLLFCADGPTSAVDGEPRCCLIMVPAASTMGEFFDLVKIRQRK
jgi:hypothetical protein